MTHCLRRALGSSFVLAALVSGCAAVDDPGWETDLGTAQGAASTSVILNEVRANEPASDVAAEFVELVNTGSGDITIAGWTISDSYKTRHKFAAGTVLGAGRAIVVFGGASAIPAGLDNAVAASSGGLGLNNSSDTVTLRDAGGSSIGVLQYGSALSSTDGVSANRSPDGSASTTTWVLHTQLSSAGASPGKRVDGSSWGSAPPDPSPSPGSARVRIMAANTTSGADQSYDPGHGIRMFQGTEPDVVLIQEFNYGSNSAADIRSFVDLAFGTSFSYYREAGAQIPNGVISRWPILAAGEWDDTLTTTRDYAWARIDVPGTTRDLWVVSVHFLTRDEPTRNTQANAVVDFIQARVPASDYLVVGGDFNTTARTEDCITTLSSVVRIGSPYPVDQNGDGDTNATRARPYDWVLADADLDPLQVATTIGSWSFPDGLVFDSRTFTQAQLDASFAPVLQGDSGASGMQHMGVYRDFAIPAE